MAEQLLDWPERADELSQTPTPIGQIQEDAKQFYVDVLLRGGTSAASPFALIRGKQNGGTVRVDTGGLLPITCQGAVDWTRMLVHCNFQPGGPVLPQEAGLDWTLMGVLPVDGPLSVPRYGLGDVYDALRGVMGMCLVAAVELSLKPGDPPDEQVRGALLGLVTGKLASKDLSVKVQPQGDSAKARKIPAIEYFGERLGPPPFPGVPNPNEQRASLRLPAKRLVKTAAAAEQYAAELLQALGFPDARVTPVGPDGGVDVDGSGIVAQVKMEGVVTGRPVIQSIFGVAALDRGQAAVFSLAGYTAQALEWAEAARVACFEFSFDGSIEPRTSVAEELLAHPKLS